MMGNILKSIGVLIFTSGIALADDAYKNWPLKGDNEKSAEAQAAFKEQCEKWANENSSSDKMAFVDNCVKRMTKVWPLGYADSGD